MMYQIEKGPFNIHLIPAYINKKPPHRSTGAFFFTHLDLLIWWWSWEVENVLSIACVSVLSVEAFPRQ